MSREATEESCAKDVSVRRSRTEVPFQSAKSNRCRAGTRRFDALSAPSRTDE